MNNFVGIGRMVKDAELRYTGQGTAVASFTIAINRMKKDEADFLNCVCFKAQAENLANYTSKGSQVAVEGRVQTRNYQNQEGKKVYVTEILANRVQFLDSKKDSGNQSNNQNSNQSQNQTRVDNDPFQNNNGIEMDPGGFPF
jgi:single-strand DNA-binding protein